MTIQHQSKDDQDAQAIMPENSARPFRVGWHLPRYETFLVPLILSLLSGMALMFYQPNFYLFQWPVPIFLGCLLLGLLILSHNKTVIQGTLFLLALLLGAGWFQLFAFNTHSPNNIRHFAPNQTALIQGEVLHYQSDHKQFLISVHQVNHQASTGHLLVKGLSPSQTNLAGQIIRFTGNLYTPYSSGVPGSFDAINYYKTQEVSALVNQANHLEILTDAPLTLHGHLNHWLGDTRNKITALVTQRMPSPTGEVLGGLVLGRHAIPVDKNTKNNFINTGLIHLLAASGLNVGIVAGFIYWICQRIGLTPTLRIAMAITGVLVYALLTGLPPSILRASAMLEIALLLKLFKKELSPLSLLCLASGILLAIKPVLIGNIGFQMSFLSTFGIIAMVPYFQNLLSPYITRVVAGIILVPAIAQLWVLPITLYYFNQFPIHSLLLNILAVAVVAPLTIMGFSIGLVSLLWQPASVLLTWLALPLVTVLLWIVNLGSQWKEALMTVASPPVFIIIVLYFVLFKVGIYFNHKHQSDSERLIPLSPFDFIKNIEKHLTLKKSLASLLCLTLMLAGFNYFKQTHLKQTEITLIPLSFNTHALLLKAEHTQEYLTLLPEKLSYWESRQLLDYLRHKNIKTLTQIALWQENGHATQTSDKNNTRPEASPGMSNLLKTIQTDRPIIYLKNATHHHTLQWGNLTIKSLTSKPKQWFKIQSPHFCINAGQTLASSLCQINLFKQEGRHPMRIFDDASQPILNPSQSGIYQWRILSQ